MAFNLTGLAAALSGMPAGYLNAQTAQSNLALAALQRRQAILDLQRQQALPRIADAIDNWAQQDAAAVPYAQPMLAPPSSMPPPIGAGQPSVPRGTPTPPQPSAGYGMTGPAIPSRTVPRSPTPAVAGSSLPFVPGGNDLRTMWRQFRRANPGADNMTLLGALGQMRPFMNSEAKQQMDLLNFGVRLSGQQNTLNIANNRIDALMDRLKFTQDQITHRHDDSYNRRETEAENRERNNLEMKLSQLGGEIDPNDTLADLRGKIASAERTAAANRRTGSDKATDTKIWTESMRQADRAQSQIDKLIKAHDGAAPDPASDDGKEIARLRKLLKTTTDAGNEAFKRLRARGEHQPYDVMRAKVREGAAAAGSEDIGTKNNPATPETQADFDALPSGAYYTDPDNGKLYVKP